MCTRLLGACIATAALSTPLAACATDSKNQEVTRQHESSERFTIADLQPLPPDVYAPPYDGTTKAGKRCTLVTYRFPHLQEPLYEFNLLREKRSIVKARGASTEDVEYLMNNPPAECR
jgi:hypothetical protein